MNEEYIDPNKSYIYVDLNGTLYEVEVSDFHKPLQQVMADFKKQVFDATNNTAVSSFVVDDMPENAQAGDPIDFYFAKQNIDGDDETMYPVAPTGEELSLADWEVHPNDELYVLTEAVPGGLTL